MAEVNTKNIIHSLNLASRPSYRIKHLLPGRIRLYIPSLVRARNRVHIYEETWGKLDGVIQVRGNYITGTILLLYDPDRLSLSRLIYLINNTMWSQKDLLSCERNYSTNPAHHRTGQDDYQDKPSLVYQFAGVLVTGIILGFLVFQRFLIRWFPILKRLPVRGIASGTALLAGVPILKEGVEDMITYKRISLDFMVSMAALIAIFTGEGLVALEVVWLMNCGTLLEDFTAERSRRAIRKLLEIGKDKAWVARNGAIIRVPIEEVVPNDIVVVHGGEKILVDGEVSEGGAIVDQAPITGESIPVEKIPGDTVFAGTLVTQGTIYIRAHRVGDDTYLARVLQMVEESLEKKAPIVSISDRFAAWFVPSAILLSFVVFGLTRNFYRAFTVLVTACPCAAAIATPTAISAAIGNAARRNMLIKGGIYIEQATRIDTLCLDKTGTITEGRPQVATVISIDKSFSEDDLITFAASAEARSHHPLAFALLGEAENRGIRLIEPASFESIAGQGVVANLKEKGCILVGSKRLMEENGINIRRIDERADRMRRSGETILYVALEKRLIGLIGVIDMPRPEAAHVIKEIQHKGIKVYLITGDHKKTAEAISKQLSITDYQYDMLPEDKAAFIDKLKKDGKTVAMVGDGVNDALALAVSDLGIAMGAGGSDVAIETADIALKANDLTRIPALFDLSFTTIKIIKQNYIYSMGINALGISLGAFGVISPLMGGVIHVINSLGVILNSSRILFIKDGV